MIRLATGFALTGALFLFLLKNLCNYLDDEWMIC